MSGQIPINSLPSHILYNILKHASNDDPRPLMLVCKHWNQTCHQEMRREWEKENIKKFKEIKHFDLKECALYYKKEYLAIAKKTNFEIHCMFNRQSMLIENKFHTLREKIAPLLQRFGFNAEIPNPRQLQLRVQALYKRFLEILRVDRNHKGMWTVGIPSGVKQMILGHLLFSKPASIRICHNWNRFFNGHFQNVLNSMRDDETTPSFVSQAIIDIQTFYNNERGFTLLRKLFLHYSIAGPFTHLSRELLNKRLIQAVNKSRNSDLCLFWRTHVQRALRLPNFAGLQKNAPAIRGRMQNEQVQQELKKIHDLKINIGNRAIYQDIKNIPPEIGYLENLNSLKVYCTSVYVYSLPYEFATLVHLQRLTLRGLGLRLFPQQICDLKFLEHLDLSGNKIASIPREVKGLENLTFLDLSFSCFGNWPVALNQLGSLKTLIAIYCQLNSFCLNEGDFGNMQKLDISNNHELVSLPLQIGSLQRLEFLALSCTGIVELPHQISDLKNLKILKLRKTLLRRFPPHMPELEHINLKEMFHLNMITEYPKIVCKDLLISPKLAELIKQCKKVQNSFCATMFSHLYVLASLYSQSSLCRLNMTQKGVKDSQEMRHLQKKIGHAFDSLEEEDKVLFYEAIAHFYGVNAKNTQWGKEHLFQDKDMFLYAMERVMHIKFQELPEELKNLVFGRIYQLAGSPQLNNLKRWKKNNLFKDWLRFFNALAFFTEPPGMTQRY